MAVVNGTAVVCLYSKTETVSIQLCLILLLAFVHWWRISSKLIIPSALTCLKWFTMCWVAGVQRVTEGPLGWGEGVRLTLVCPFGPRPRRCRKSGISQARQGHLIQSPHPITALSPGQMRSIHGGQEDLSVWWRCDNQQQGVWHLTPLCLWQSQGMC